MKPLWASVFMMLAMFLQSSAERAQRHRVREGLAQRRHLGCVPSWAPAPQPSPCEPSAHTAPWPHQGWGCPAQSCPHHGLRLPRCHAAAVPTDGRSVGRGQALPLFTWD